MRSTIASSAGLSGAACGLVVAPGRAFSRHVNLERPFPIVVSASKPGEVPVAGRGDFILSAIGLLLGLEGQRGAHGDGLACDAADPRVASARLLFEDIAQNAAGVDVPAAERDEIVWRALAAVQEEASGCADRKYRSRSRRELPAYRLRRQLFQHPAALAARSRAPSLNPFSPFGQAFFRALGLRNLRLQRVIQNEDL